MEYRIKLVIDKYDEGPVGEELDEAVESALKDLDIEGWLVNEKATRLVRKEYAEELEAPEGLEKFIARIAAMKRILEGKDYDPIGGKSKEEMLMTVVLNILDDLPDNFVKK